MQRRQFIRGTAATAALALGAPHLARAQSNAIKLAIIDSWIPGANEVFLDICRQWSEQSGTTVEVDFVTTQGDAITNIAAAESLAQTGHDMISTLNWATATFSRHFVEVDDVMEELRAEYGEPSDAVRYLSTQQGGWTAVPSLMATQAAPCGVRIDLMRDICGLDIVELFPVGEGDPARQAELWNWNKFSEYAAACKKAGSPFYLGLSKVPDSVNWVGAAFASHGAYLIDADGKSTLDSPEVLEVLEFFKSFVPSLPETTYSFDNTTNNKALISGQSAAVFNSPSAWAVATTDNPEVGSNIWHVPPPSGPQGSFLPRTPSALGIWKFSDKQDACKDLIRFIWKRENVEKLVNASAGNELPAFPSLMDFAVWRDAGPPAGTLYNYPPRGAVRENVAGMPAPANIAAQLFNRGTMADLIARYNNDGRDAAFDWAETELRSIVRR